MVWLGSVWGDWFGFGSGVIVWFGIVLISRLGSVGGEFAW